MQRGSIWRHLAGMTEFKLQQLRAALKAKQTALEGVLGRRDAIAVERNADPAEEAQTALSRELAIRALEQESCLLLAIKVALRRMDEGTYGTCCGCDEEISEKRLAAVPWAIYCLDCQESADSATRSEELLAAS